MLEALKFVQGAVAKKDFVPALTHFKIQNRMVMGFNGNLAICSPIECDLNICPNAAQFVKALSACTETITLHLNEKKRLVVRSGNFQTFVDCDDPNLFPVVVPVGHSVQLDPALLQALGSIEPFIATDASRPWACGVMFNGESCYATNNIILIQYWLGYLFPCRVNIPSAAIAELLRIGVAPERMQVTEQRLVFHYTDGRWLSTQLLDANWPVEIEPLLNKLDYGACSPVPAGFWEALELLNPFTDEIGRVYLQGSHMSTISNAEIGGTAIAQDCHDGGVYNGRQLLNLNGVADSFDFNQYPNSVPFTGPLCRGIIAGIRS